MQRGKIALGYYVTNIFLLQKLLFRNPSFFWGNSFWENFSFFWENFYGFWENF
jgi:hypothetical protein